MHDAPWLLQRLPSTLSNLVQARTKSAFYVILARSPDCAKLLPIWSAWRQYWRQQRRQAAQIKIFNTFRIREGLRRCFHTWRHLWVRKKESCKAQDCKLLIRRYAVLHMMWNLWATITRGERNAFQTRACVFNAWFQRVLLRKRKEVLEERHVRSIHKKVCRRICIWNRLAKSMAWHRARMVYWTLRAWLKHTRIRKELQLKKVLFLASPTRNRRAFGRWKSALISERRSQVCLSGLLRDFFTTWKSNAQFVAGVKRFTYQNNHELLSEVFDEWRRFHRRVMHLMRTYARRFCLDSTTLFF